MSDVPERIALRWVTGAAVTSGPLMTHPEYTQFVRADLAQAPDAGVAELVEAAERVADQDAKPEHPGRYAELRQTIHGLRAALAKLGVR